MRDRASRLLLGDRPRPVAAGVVVGALSVCAITLAIYPVRSVAPVVSAGVLYLLAVLVVSTGWGLALGVGTGVAGALAFNFFHIEPTGRFTIADGENWVALVVFLAAAVVVSSVADIARERTAEARRGRAEADLAVRALLLAAVERDRLLAEVDETRALRHSDTVKTAILRSVSHDLRSPLTAILAAGEALGSATIDDEDRTALAATVAGETDRLARLVDKLLDLSRLEAGSAVPRPDWCAVDEVLDAAVHGQPDPSRFAVSVADDLPLVRVDGAQLERALANLLENAARFSAPHPVQVRARAVGSRLVIRVVDRGPGIPVGERRLIFEPFHRADGAGGQGSGLGLAIVKGFVEVNGGRVAVESLPGQGTTFVIDFPLPAAAPAPVPGTAEGRHGA